MKEQRLVQLLTSILGTGTKQGLNYYNFKCPVCQHKNHKLAVQIVPTKKYPTPGGWKCFHCEDVNKMHGKSIKSLLKRANASKTITDEIYSLLDLKYTTFVDNIQKTIQLPEGFVSLYNYTPTNGYETNFYDSVLTYLINERKLTLFDILKYNIGMCINGSYSKRIVIPSYDISNKLNYFVTRTITDEGIYSYRNPPSDMVSKTEVIPFENTINWNEPIILVEGVFDMFSVRRNCIPLLGKVMSDKLLSKLLDSSVEKIYICLDTDAIKNSLIHCERLMNFGKEVYFVDIEGKDPNNIGFEKINQILQNTYPLNFSDLMRLKIRSMK